LTTALNDHHQFISGFIQSHRIRNLAESTIKKEESFLKAWFDSQGENHRPLFAWEAMDVEVGRKIVVDYGKLLLESGITTHTIRSYLGLLRRFFSYVLEHPLVYEGNKAIRIQDRYGVILFQPVSEFDMPRYVYDGERAGVPMDPAKLYEFYAVLRRNYLSSSGFTAIRERNYAMTVLAGETGLRVDELIHLEVDKDLLFDSKKVQTRHAKAAKGSGKRCRSTLFPPLARDTMKFYLSRSRKYLATSSTPWLFPSKTGRRLAYATAQAALKEMVTTAQAHDFPVADHMTWHWFRRIFATTFIENHPGKLPVLIELLGHMSPNTVHRYIRHSEAWIDKQIQEVLEGSWASIGS
jgi:site-specific recombinase XerD